MNADDHVRSVLIGEAVDQAGYVVLVADDRMCFLTASEGACALLGYTRDELATMTVPEIVQEADATELYRDMLRERDQDGRVTLVCKDGRRVAATYEARETVIGGLKYYVSLLRPE